MIVIPAIDLHKGKCVRLLKGKLENVKVYYENPLDVARLFIELGVKVLHIVDLDGAFGIGNNYEIIKNIINLKSFEIQVGGGIRSIEKAEELYSLGVDRVICGTAAIKDPEFVIKLVDSIGSKHVMVALDHRDGKILIKGWQEDTKLDVFNIAKKMENKGAGSILFTSAAVDGTLMGPDIENIKKLVNTVKIPVIAAGGIGNLEDLKKIEATGAYGVVVGKAIYEGKIKLDEALKIFE
ncbi:MAG: 1-(5-phosphoribosyl)-5-[(5-phosphoribosylamino)methylideneamino]imidazole-4-carboxamide isomerase [Candidatus Helarchaeota archaeon]